ncbi:VOC family protein [Streptomyces sp. NPDC059017]
MSTAPLPRIALVTLVVRDYDEAVAFYRDALEDLYGNRWDLLQPA